MPETAIAIVDRGEQLRELAESARTYADAGMAANTRRAYASDWRDFATWCETHGAPTLPADPATVALYLTDRAKTLTAATLSRRIAAINAAHAQLDLPKPENARLREIWAGIRRTHGRPPVKKRALVTDDLRKVVRKLPDTPAGLRDRAILLLGFAAALRRSELAALQLAHQREYSSRSGPDMGQIRLVFVAAGLEIHIDRSKGDQAGEGAIVGVPRGRTLLCPVAAVTAWLQAASITSGPVFRHVDRHGRVGALPINGAAIAAIVKRAAKSAGLDPAVVGGHSLRAGLITSAAANDVPADVIMRQSRHARFDTMRGYIREAERFKRNAAAKVGL